jgi:hypothetical protein
LIKVLDVLAATGVASCPVCGANVLLNELKAVPTGEKVMEAGDGDEDSETKQARPQLYDQLASILRPAGKGGLAETVFDGKGLDFGQTRYEEDDIMLWAEEL